MSIYAYNLEKTLDNFKIEYPFLEVNNPTELQFSKLGEFIAVIGDVKTNNNLPIPAKIYHNFVIGIFSDRRKHPR